MKKIILFALTLLILAACSSTPKVDLSGEWKLVSYGDVANPTPAVPDADTSFKFENGQFNGHAGCNSFGGGYELRGDKIAFNGIFSTEMYCEETSVQEQGVLAMLADNPNLQIQLNGNTLTIASADGSSVLTLERK
jgi:heat shock protein HslJ